MHIRETLRVATRRLSLGDRVFYDTGHSVHAGEIVDREGEDSVLVSFDDGDECWIGPAFLKVGGERVWV